MTPYLELVGIQEQDSFKVLAHGYPYIVIVSISSGLTLLDLSSSLRYMITGGVLAIAVIVDSPARQSRVAQGRA